MNNPNYLLSTLGSGFFMIFCCAEHISVPIYFAHPRRAPKLWHCVCVNVESIGVDDDGRSARVYRCGRRVDAWRAQASRDWRTRSRTVSRSASMPQQTSAERLGAQRA